MFHRSELRGVSNQTILEYQVIRKTGVLYQTSNQEEVVELVKKEQSKAVDQGDVNEMEWMRKHRLKK